jgi:hypothetical protein
MLSVPQYGDAVVLAAIVNWTNDDGHDLVTVSVTGDN